MGEKDLVEDLEKFRRWREALGRAIELSEGETKTLQELTGWLGKIETSIEQILAKGKMRNHP